MFQRTIKKVERKFIEQEKKLSTIFLVRYLEHIYIFRIFKEFAQFKKTIQLKMYKGYEYTFLQEGIQMANKYMKQCLTSLVIKEM